MLNCIPQSTICQWEKIPAELKRLRRWLTWRFRERPGGGKPEKVPFNFRTGWPADASDSNTHGSFHEALAAYRTGRFSGLGFVFTPDDPYVGIDFDDCRDPQTGKVCPQVLEIIRRLGTYTEVSPSGTGLHAIAKVHDKAAFLELLRLHGSKHGPAAIFGTARYFTFTGAVLDGYMEIRDCMDELVAIVTDTAAGKPQAEVADEPEPSEAEIRAATRAARNLLPKRALELIEGGVETSDRSGQAAELGHLLVESGITDPRTVATIVFGSEIHRRKFATRRDAWTDAQRIAARVLAKHDATVVSEAQAEAPTETTAPGLPLFPEDAAVGICADIARVFADRLEAPFEFWYASALTCLGAGISGCITLDTALAPQPRLYTAIIGPTASPRKSTAIGMTARFFEEALAPLEALHFEYGLGSAEGLAEVLQRNDGRPARCVLLLDELRLLVQKARIEHSALLPMLCSVYHANDFANSTRRTKIRLRDAHISLLGACTEDTFSSMWTPEFLAIGFINRLFLVPGRPSRSIAMPEPVPQGQRDELARKLLQLVEDAHRRSTVTLVVGGQNFPLPGPEPRKLRLTPDALHLWQQWYNNRPTGVHADRLDDLGLRLMVLTEVSRGNLRTVERDTAERVIKILDWQYAVRRVYDPIDAESRMAAMEQRIKRVLLAKGPLGERELRQHAHASRAGLWLFQRALQNLVEAGVVGKSRRGRTYTYSLLDTD